jgi:hypothetical protein
MKRPIEIVHAGRSAREQAKPLRRALEIEARFLVDEFLEPGGR